jgi:Xaa-Pro dipeptidase
MTTVIANTHETSQRLAFPLQEYAERVEKLRRTMAASGIEVLVLDEFEHLAYYTGHAPTAAMYQCCLMPLTGDPVLIVRSLDAPMLKEASWVREHVLFDDSQDPIEVTADTLRARGWERARVGFESDSHIMLVSRLHALKVKLPSAEFVDFGGHIWLLRQTKSPLEIAYLEQCSHICDIGTLAGIEAAAVGVPERDVAAAIYAAALKAGADNTRLLLMQSGPRSSTLHGALGNRTLTDGDLLHIEMVPHLRGYTARSMRPVSIGKPTQEQLFAAKTMVELQNRQFEAMVPGALALEVDAIIRQGILHSGLAETYTNVSGYTLGLVAIPRTSDFTRVFVPNATWQLEENMVFHMYTMAQGMAFSETVQVTPQGGKRLTQLKRALFTV